MHPSIIRTNPKGQPGIGYCPTCGKDNLPLFDINGECTGDMTQEVALLQAINGETDESNTK